MDVYFNFIGRVKLPAEERVDADAEIEAAPQKRYVAPNTMFATLGEYLMRLEAQTLVLSFEEVERIIGRKLCKSAYRYASYWYPGVNRPVGNVVYNAGYDVERVDVNK